jgi:uncharacterized membrane protein YuzA (DUF378 family)
MKMSTLDWVAWVLVVVGALNWGLVAFNFNLVEMLFGTSMLTTWVYGLVGLAGLYFVWTAMNKSGKKK